MTASFSPFELFRAALGERVDSLRSTFEGLVGQIQFEAQEGPRTRSFVVALDGAESWSFIGAAAHPDAVVEISQGNAAGLLRGAIPEPISVYGDLQLVHRLLARLSAAAPAGNWLDMRARRGK